MVLEHYCIIGKAFVFAIGLQIALAAPVKELGDWPAGAGPVEIGKRVAERFAASHPGIGMLRLRAQAEDVHDLVGLRAVTADPA